MAPDGVGEGIHGPPIHAWDEMAVEVHRHLDRIVTELVFDIGQVFPSHDEEAGKGVAQAVRGEVQRERKGQEREQPPDTGLFGYLLIMEIVEGTAVVKGPQEVTVTLSDPELKQWATNQLAMMAVHRWPRSFDEVDGKSVLTLEEDDEKASKRKVGFIPQQAGRRLPP